MSPKQGQERPAQPGGENHSLVGSAQASQAVKRRAEEEGDCERIRGVTQDVDLDMRSLIVDHRDRYLESISGQDEHVSGEMIALLSELEEDATRWSFYDDISGEVLDTKQVQQARKHEIKIIQDMGVWEKIPRSQMPLVTKTSGARWADVRKQDEEKTRYRSRLVGQETRHGTGFHELFAAMPRLSPLTMLLAVAVSCKLLVWEKKAIMLS